MYLYICICIYVSVYVYIYTEYEHNMILFWYKPNGINNKHIYMIIVQYIQIYIFSSKGFICEIQYNPKKAS